MELIIGSTAIKHHFPDFRREPKDLDVFGPAASGDTYWHPQLLQYWWNHPRRYATPSELYTLKVSHSYWELPNGSWGKHIADAMFLKAKGARLIPELHALLYALWEEKYGKKRADLTKESTEFFADAVQRKYDHDSLHVSVAYGDRPLYESVLKDGSSVQMDMKKVWAMPFVDRVRLFREEMYATALERIIIPSDYRASPGMAYAWALRRTITSLTKGASAQFLVENYDTFATADSDYVVRHLSRHHLLIPLER